MEGLDYGRFGDPFAGWILVRVRTAESIEEFRFGTNGPELHRAGTVGRARVRLGCFGDIADRIGEDFGSKSLAVVAREVSVIATVRFIRLRRKRIGMGLEDRFEELFLIETDAAKMRGELI